MRAPRLCRKKDKKNVISIRRPSFASLRQISIVNISLLQKKKQARDEKGMLSKKQMKPKPILTARL